jgi:hypothetical protein
MYYASIEKSGKPQSNIFEEILCYNLLDTYSCIRSADIK